MPTQTFKIGKENMKVKDGVAFRTTEVSENGFVAKIEAGGEPYRPKGQKTRMSKEELDRIQRQPRRPASNQAFAPQHHHESLAAE